MKLTCYKDGKELKLKDPLDVEYIEYEIVQDFLKVIGHLESNPTARIEIDFTEPYLPKYNLVNCNLTFTRKFNKVVNRKKLA
ncbi:MAG: hypothetical protein V2I54_06520 [Bacteroidales bacterium]|jgi:hypothetical protein|nr:hypothetical protein [Bacteroidales bacterium]